MSARQAAFAALMAGVCSASVAQPGVTVSYLQPTGTVGVTDNIEVWVRVAADHAYGTNEGVPFGFNVSELPANGHGYDPALGTSHDQPFVSYTSLQILAGWSCSNACSPAGYSFQRYQGLNAWSSQSGANLYTGTFLVGTYVPVAGGVAPGTHAFALTPEIQFNVRGVSASGTELSALIGSTSSACFYTDRPACTFTRTVVSSVPEPGMAWMGLLGLVGMAGAVRRGRRAC